MTEPEVQIAALKLGIVALRGALFEVLGGKPTESLQDLLNAFEALPARTSFDETRTAAIHAIEALRMTEALV